MILRFANELDIPRILELLQQNCAVHHQVRPDMFRDDGRKFDAEDLKRFLADPMRPILAAELDGQLVGYAMCILQITENDTAAYDRKVLYLDDLCVDAPCRGKNVASVLYNHVLDYAREIGCNAVTLHVWKGNDRAMRFYEKQGMQVQKIGMEVIL